MVTFVLLVLVTWMMWITLRLLKFPANVLGALFGSVIGWFVFPSIDPGGAPVEAIVVLAIMGFCFGCVVEAISTRASRR